MDLYHRHFRPEASQKALITVGRTSTVVFLLLAWAWAPFLVSFERIFSYIQEFWGLITPGVAVVFLSGLFWKRATGKGAVWVMGLTLPITLGIKALTPNAAFLDQMWLAGIALFLLLAGISLMWSEDGSEVDDREHTPGEPDTGLPERDLLFDVLSMGAVVATVALVVFFW
jgi:SSS family solute:Na+ symporter